MPMNRSEPDVPGGPVLADSKYVKNVRRSGSPDRKLESNLEMLAPMSVRATDP